MKHILLACLLAAAPALAETTPIVATDTPGSVAIALRLDGFRADLEDDDGTPVIYSGVGGTNFSIRFYDCRRGKACRGLLFVSSFDLDAGLPLDRINEWNASEWLGRAWLDDECDAIFEHFVVADPEMSEDQFRRVVRHWDRALQDFRRFIGFDAPDRATTEIAQCDGASEPV